MYRGIIGEGSGSGRWSEGLLARGLVDLLPKNARVYAVRHGCAPDCLIFVASWVRERQFRDVDELATEVLRALASFLAATSRNRCRLSGDAANRGVVPQQASR